MKRILLFTTMLLCSVAMWAQTFTVDGITYKVTNTNPMEVQVGTGGTSPAIENTITGTIEIPSSVMDTNGNSYSVTSIGSYAFRGCSGLTSITIPNSVKTIDSHAFQECSGLTSINIPNSVTSIGIEAFMGCSSLTSITIPNSVTSIGDYAFVGCSGLTAIVVESGNPVYDSRENCNAIIKTSSNTLHTGCKSTVIPNNVKKIGESAFSGCSCLSSITIPNSVTSIESHAFYGCSGLTSINIPNSVTSIGIGAFEGCSGLTSITIPNSVTSIGGIAFWGCSGLTSITIPNSVTSIESHAFYGCSGLTSVTIPNSVTSIGSSAFEGCLGLTAITIPNSVKTIDSHAFQKCSGLTSINIPNSVTSIGIYAFCGCFGLTSVTIGNSVTSIGDRAFCGCSGLASIVVESGNSVYDSRDNCNAIIETNSNTLHTGCKSTAIPNSVTSIGSSAFCDCSGLTSINIPNSVTSIGESAFDSCSGLTSINIPNSVTSIGESAFDSCSGLTSINIPNSVTSIGDRAFFYCSGLTSITIPNSVTSIGGGAFSGCSGLTSIVVDSGNPVYDSRENCNAIIETSSNTLQTGCKNTVIPNSVTSIGHDAFYGCNGLTSITIPNSVTSILGRAFRVCTSLTSITIPNSVSSIGDGAFYMCSGLTSVIVEWEIPINIDSYAFHSENYQNATLYVPKGSKGAYQSADSWKKFNVIVEISKGDLNGDDEYNISDIILIIDMITGNGDDDFVATYMADVNGDGEVDIADIIAIINLMIEQESNNAPELAMAPMEEAQETSDHITASITGNELSVDLDNSNQYTGFQMLVTVPNGLQLTDATLDASRGNKHSVLLRQVAEGQYLVIGYSLSNSVLKGNTGKLLTLTTEGVQNGDIIISNVMFATADAEKYLLSGISLSGSATGIEDIDGSLSAEDIIYDLNGHRLTAVPKNGVYIKKGKKYIRKGNDIPVDSNGI